jgi:hypothetical protein
MSFTGTTQEIAVVLGTDYNTAHGVLKLLKAKGIATEVDTRPAKGGKGKPSSVYSIPQTVTLTFASATAETTAA